VLKNGRDFDAGSGAREAVPALFSPFQGEKRAGTASPPLAAVECGRSAAWSMLETIRKAWGWIGLNPAEVVATNSFGNVIPRATDGAYWRICPEEWSCERVARDAGEFAALWGDEEFRRDWEMTRLVELARQQLGPLPEGRCYCLKLPAVIGGGYEATNLGTIALDELIAFSGDMAEQIKDVPDGGQLDIKIVP
jgi:hypothetical protein